MSKLTGFVSWWVHGNDDAETGDKLRSGEAKRGGKGLEIGPEAHDGWLALVSSLGLRGWARWPLRLERWSQAGEWLQRLGGGKWRLDGGSSGWIVARQAWGRLRNGLGSWLEELGRRTSDRVGLVLAERDGERWRSNGVGNGLRR